MQDVTISKELI